MINFDLLDSQNYILNERTLYETIQKYLSVFINHHTYFFSEIRSHEEHQKRLSFQKLIFTGTVRVKFDQTSKQYKQMIPQLSSYLDSNPI